MYGLSVLGVVCFEYIFHYEIDSLNIVEVIRRTRKENSKPETGQPAVDVNPTTPGN